MDNRSFQRLLDRCARLAEQHAKATRAVSDELEARFGCTPGDVDCDDIIERMDYHGGRMTVREVEAAMREAIALSGAPS